MRLRTLLIFAMSSLMLLMAGCIKEDLSVCVTRTSFKCVYDFNKAESDLFDQLVNKVDVYIFDASGLLVKHLSQVQDYLPQGYTISTDLKYGRYTAVLYGTVNGNNGVAVGAKQGDLTKALKAMKVGENRIEDLRLMLNSLNGYSDKDLNVVLHGMVSQFEVTSAEKEPYNVSFIRNTSVVEMNIRGLENLVSETRALSDIAVRIEGNNKAYLHDNTLDMELGKVNHAPYWQRFSNDVLAVKSSVLRLFKEYPMTLKIYNGNDVIWKLNLTAEIMKSPHYDTNEDLDREDTFVINVTVNTAGDFTIVVNGWTTTTSSDIIG